MQGMPPATGRTAPTLRQALHIRRSLASGRAAVHARSGPVNRFRRWPAEMPAIRPGHRTERARFKNAQFLTILLETEPVNASETLLGIN